MANYTALLHVREPEMVARLPNPEREASIKRANGITVKGRRAGVVDEA